MGHASPWGSPPLWLAPPKSGHSGPRGDDVTILMLLLVLLLQLMMLLLLLLRLEREEAFDSLCQDVEALVGGGRCQLPRLRLLFRACFALCGQMDLL